MKKLDFIKVLFAAIVFSAGVSAQTVWNGTADTSWYDKEEKYLTITTAEQLAGLAQLVNSGTTMLGKVITLGADIMLNDTTDWKNWAATAPANAWTPIGNREIRKCFQGLFDGDGYIVSGVYINNSNDFQGFFSYVVNITGVRNLSVVASYVQGNNYVGGLTGHKGDRNRMNNCSFTGNVQGNNYVGGLAGQNEGSITYFDSTNNCYAAGNVKGNDYVGGITGLNFGIITNYSFTGNVEGNERVGGLAGYNDSSITDCYAAGDVQGTKDVGGLVGINIEGTIENCYATGDVQGTKDVGGLAGRNYVDSGYDGNSVGIIYCYATGNVKGNIFVGGLTGSNDNGYSVSNCYATGNVEGTGDYIGGLTGYNGGGEGDNRITNCYATGNVTGTGNYVGGLTGRNNGIITNCYYDSETSGRNDEGKGDPKTTAQMKRQDTYSVVWYFDVIWAIDGNINNGYPYLLSLAQSYDVFISVSEILGIPTSAAYGQTITLNPTVLPQDATNKTIVLSVKSGGAVINGNNITFTQAGQVTIRATIASGLGRGSDYTKNFVITVSGNTPIRDRQTPKPFGITLNGGVVSQEAKIKVIAPEQAQINLAIYDNLGNVAFEKSGVRNDKEILWNLTNSAGRYVANGGYLIIAEAKGVSGKVYRYSAKVGVKK